MLTLAFLRPLWGTQRTVTIRWIEFTSVFSVIDDVTISYYLLICASAFCAIAEAQAKSDTQFLLASLDATGRLWEAARIPLCLQMCYHASEALGPFVWAAISRAREIAAGTLADAARAGAHVMVDRPYPLNEEYMRKYRLKLHDWQRRRPWQCTFIDTKGCKSECGTPCAGNYVR